MYTANKIGLHDFQPIFNINYCLQNALLRGFAQDPAGGLTAPPDPQQGNVGSHSCRGSHRIAGSRASRHCVHYRHANVLNYLEPLTFQIYSCIWVNSVYTAAARTRPEVI